MYNNSLRFHFKTTFNQIVADTRQETPYNDGPEGFTNVQLLGFVYGCVTEDIRVRKALPLNAAFKRAHNLGQVMRSQTATLPAVADEVIKLYNGIERSQFAFKGEYSFQERARKWETRLHLMQIGRVGCKKDESKVIYKLNNLPGLIFDFRDIPAGGELKVHMMGTLLDEMYRVRHHLIDHPKAIMQDIHFKSYVETLGKTADYFIQHVCNGDEGHAQSFKNVMMPGAHDLLKPGERFAFARDMGARYERFYRKYQQALVWQQSTVKR